jgi:hypothetical protein
MTKLILHQRKAALAYSCKAYMDRPTAGQVPVCLLQTTGGGREPLAEGVWKAML